MPIYRHADGKYLVRINYKSLDGKYQTKTKVVEGSKNYAKKVEFELLQQFQNKTEDKELTFNELYERFLESKKNEVKASTFRQYKNSIPPYVLSFFGKRKIQSLTPNDIIKWKNEISKHNFKHLYNLTIYKNFKSLFEFGRKMYGINSDPFAFIKPFKNNQTLEEEPLRFWTLEQFKIFDNAAKKKVESIDDDISSKYHYETLRTMFNILYWAGLRKGEAFALTWKDIIKTNELNFIRVNKTLNQKCKPHEITPPKNKSSNRKVPICKELQKVIDDHYNFASKIDGFNEDFYIIGDFINYGETYLTNFKNELIKETGLPFIRIHDFRHSCCSLLINGGLPLPAIAALLGHSNIEITQKVYTHIFPSTNDAVVEYLNSLKL